MESQLFPKKCFILRVNRNLTNHGNDRSLTPVHTPNISPSIYYMPSTFYIVQLPLALSNIFHWTESILAQSDDDAKNPY